jgi:3-hydroxyisobutyrate dehydrogenase
MPGLALANQLDLSLAAHGHGRSGTQALQLALAALSNVDWQQR